MDPDAVRSVDRVPHGGGAEESVLDFSANTNPETPEGVAEVYETALSTARSYPPEPPTGFRRAAAAVVDCDPGSVVPMPGGLAAIRAAVETTVASGDSVLLPAPSFGEYAREVRLQGADPVFVDHDGITETDPSGHALAMVCNPNNPTGEAYDAGSLREFAVLCRETGTTLLVDEAFLPFTDRPTMAGTDGVVVARSLTKLFGLPGLRAGYAVATGTLLERLLAARRPWNVGTPALAVGEHCLGDREFVERTRSRVASERARMRETLTADYDVHPSEAPFLLLDVGDRRVENVLERAMDAGIRLRDARTFRGLESHVRVAVRRPAENDRLLEVLGAV